MRQIFGSNLRSYRKSQNLSQEQLAERLNISVKHLSTLETGKVFASAELIESIAKELSVPVSSLFYTPEEKSFDDSDISRIEKVLEEEAVKFQTSARERIRRINDNKDSGKNSSIENTEEK